jgi:transposase-like protein
MGEHAGFGSPTFTLQNRLSESLVARKHSVGASQLFNWRKLERTDKDGDSTLSGPAGGVDLTDE